MLESTPRNANPKDPPETVGGQGGVVVLEDPHRLKSDCKMLERAIREGWEIPHDRKPDLVNRLLDIVEKKAYVFRDEDGNEQRAEAPADKNAIAAARVIATLTQQNQASYHKAAEIDAKIKTPDVTALQINIILPRHNL